MNMMCFKPRNFNIKELVDKQTYYILGDQAWKLLDIRTKMTLDKLKSKFGWIIIVNTWMFKSTKYNDSQGRPFTQRGFRNINSTVGVKDGAHYLGMGIDFDAYVKNTGKRIDPNLVRKKILDNIDEFEYIRCLEIDINWVHFDVMGHNDHEKRSSITDNKILLYSLKGNSKIIKRN